MSRRTLTLAFGVSLVLQPPVATASGDPLVIYWFSGACLVNVALLMYMLFGNSFKSKRWPSIALYALYAATLWTWAWQSRAPSFIVGGVLVLGPAIFSLVLRLLLADRPKH